MFAIDSFEPIGDKILIKRLNHRRQVGSILLPDNAIPQSQEGIVIAHGSGDRDSTGQLVPMDISSGNRVFFGKHSGTLVQTIGETEYWIMRESELIGVIVNVKSRASTDS